MLSFKEVLNEYFLSFFQEKICGVYSLKLLGEALLSIQNMFSWYKKRNLDAYIHILFLTLVMLNKL